MIKHRAPRIGRGAYDKSLPEVLSPIAGRDLMKKIMSKNKTEKFQKFGKEYTFHSYYNADMFMYLSEVRILYKGKLFVRSWSGMDLNDQYQEENKSNAVEAIENDIRIMEGRLI